MRMKKKGQPIMVWEVRIIVHSCYGDLPNRMGRIDVAESIKCMLSCEGVVCVLAARV